MPNLSCVCFVVLDTYELRYKNRIFVAKMQDLKRFILVIYKGNDFTGKK